MALISLGECKWRMIRRVLRKKRFEFDDCRNMRRIDKDHFDWLVEKGFFAPVSEKHYEVTDKGKQSAELGFYEV